MADNINAAGYETKPWWPYVRALMEGSGSVTVEQLNVTENGTYTAEAGKAYSPVVVNVPSDFSTAEVTITNNSSTGVDLMAAHTYTDETESVSNGMTQISPSETKTITAILYKDGCGYSIEGADLSTISCALTGDIEPSPFSNMFGTIQGNGTMTITDKA